MRLLLDIFGQTLRTLWAHKLRSFLTMFGIAWGVGSLLLLVGLGEGFRSGQRKSLAQLGENVMFIFPGRTPAIPGSFNSMRPYKLTYGDYLAIRDQTRYVGAVAAVLGRGDVRALSDYSSVSGGVSGVSPSYSQIRFVPIAVGRWLNIEDDAQHRRVAIIGDEVRRNLFPGRPALGAVIVLNGSRFEIVGVMRRIPRDGNGGMNIRVFVPVQTMMDLFPMRGAQEYDAIGYINYNPRTRGEHELARDEVHKIIAQRHNFDWRVKDAFNDEDTVQEEETVGKICSSAPSES
jgi:putative ABC transport system permease protein